LRARATWSQFGTPATLMRRGKFLARGIRGKTAVDPARWYLNRHKALFGLKSLDGLEFDSANPLSGSNGWVVNFRQVFKGLTAASGGLVTVTVTGSPAKGWKVVFVSSGLTRDTSLNGAVKLSAASAWVTAARGAGITRSVANVLGRRNVRGWTQFRVAGVRGNQLAKLVAFPTLRSGVVPAYETVVVDLEKALASKSFVDARTGRILARSSLVHNVASGLRPQAIPTQTFSGTVAAGDGSCAPDHVFAVTATNVRALDGFAAATVPTNDLVIDLLKDGVVLSHVNFLIDDTENTNWTAAPAIGAGGVFSADGLKVTVDLAGSDDVTVRYVQVSTMLWNDTINPNIRSGQNRFTAVRQFELWACNADEGGNCSADAGYHRVYTSPANAFPGDPPRPVAPHMILRKFDTPNFEATHVRFVVGTTQCTGTPAFQGDQDADPGVNSDCDSNASAGSATAVRSTRAFARAAELQVFDRDPKVKNRGGGH
jgi:hypothetical protein